MLSPKALAYIKKCISNRRYPKAKSSEEIYFKKLAMLYVGEMTINDIIGEQITEDMIYASIQSGKMQLYNIPYNLRTNEIYIALVKKNYKTINNVPKNILPIICERLVFDNPVIIKFIPSHLRSPKMCLYAVNHGIPLIYVPIKYRNLEICLAALANSGFVGDSLDDVIRYKPNKFCTYGNIVLDQIPLALRTPEVCREAVRRNGYSLKNVPKMYRTLSLCELAANNNRLSIKYIPTQYLNQKMCYDFVVNMRLISKDEHMMDLRNKRHPGGRNSDGARYECEMSSDYNSDINMPLYINQQYTDTDISTDDSSEEEYYNHIHNDSYEEDNNEEDNNSYDEEDDKDDNEDNLICRGRQLESSSNESYVSNPKFNSSNESSNESKSRKCNNKKSYTRRRPMNRSYVTKPNNDILSNVTAMSLCRSRKRIPSSSSSSS
jgi:hypothetical protein